MTLIFIIILGLIVGSFIGMLTYRLPRGLSIRGRSFCDNCQKQISWYQNIPVLSFFLLKGKSACCGKKISLRYPVIETITSLFFLFSFLILIWSAVLPVNPGIPFLWWLATFGNYAIWIFFGIVAIFIALSVTDIEYELLPDSLLKVLAIPVFAYLLLSPAPILFSGLLWGFLSFSFFLTIYLVTRERGMGFGDVKMSFLLGALLGFPGTLSWLFMAFLGGSLVGIILLVLGKAAIGRPIPFGPFLLFAAFIAFFFGDDLFIWYINMLT